MDYKGIETFSDGVIIKGAQNFELNNTFDCGQCFRWEKQPGGSYIGVAYGRVVLLEKQGEDI